MIVLAEAGRLLLILATESGIGVFSLLAWLGWDSLVRRRFVVGGGR